MRIAVAVAAFVAALGLLACGTGSSSTSSTGDGSSEAAEVAEAVKLIRKHERLEALHLDGVTRAGAMEGAPGSRGMEEAAQDFGEEADAIESKILAFSNSVQRKALSQINAEE